MLYPGIAIPGLGQNNEEKGMSPFRSEFRPAGASPALKTAPCPAVADLLDFAQGRAGPDDRQRIEVHLQSTSCPHCRRWLANSSSLPADPFDPPPLRSAALPPTADSSPWQQQVFQDLEKRLQQLDDGV
jgi:hypothetical protein